MAGPENAETGRGVVSLINPTGTRIFVAVNGGDEITLPETSRASKWLPIHGKPMPRTSDGNPSENAFGLGRNRLSTRMEDGQGQASNLVVTIPDWLQDLNDMQLYFYYTAKFTAPDFTLLWQGAVIDYSITNLFGKHGHPKKAESDEPGQIARPQNLHSIP